MELRALWKILLEVEAVSRRYGKCLQPGVAKQPILPLNLRLRGLVISQVLRSGIWSTLPPEETLTMSIFLPVHFSRRGAVWPVLQCGGLHAGRGISGCDHCRLKWWFWMRNHGLLTKRRGWVWDFEQKKTHNFCRDMRLDSTTYRDFMDSCPYTLKVESGRTRLFWLLRPFEFM